VELAGPVHWWLDRGGDFSFETMEAEETPFLWARQVGDGYQIGAVWQKFECATTFPGFAIRGAFRAFVEHVRSACQSELGINVDDLILTQ
jgi:hypothetical protein